MAHRLSRLLFQVHKANDSSGETTSTKGKAMRRRLSVGAVVVLVIGAILGYLGQFGNGDGEGDNNADPSQVAATTNGEISLAGTNASDGEGETGSSGDQPVDVPIQPDEGQDGNTELKQEGVFKVVVEADGYSLRHEGPAGASYESVTLDELVKRVKAWQAESKDFRVHVTSRNSALYKSVQKLRERLEESGVESHQMTGFDPLHLEM